MSEIAAVVLLTLGPLFVFVIATKIVNHGEREFDKVNNGFSERQFDAETAVDYSEKSLLIKESDIIFGDLDRIAELYDLDLDKDKYRQDMFEIGRPIDPPSEKAQLIQVDGVEPFGIDSSMLSEHSEIFL